MTDRGKSCSFFSDREPVTAHHPLAHELLLAGCFYLGHFLFGDYNLGLMIYSIVQSVTVAACAAYAVIWLRRRRIAFGYRVTALLFFGLNPLIQMLAYNTTKDTLYGAFFLLVFLLLLDLLETWNRRRAAGFAAAAVLMCLFRNQGYYILAFVCLGVFVFYAEERAEGLRHTSHKRGGGMVFYESRWISSADTQGGSAGNAEPFPCSRWPRCGRRIRLI